VNEIQAPRSRRERPAKPALSRAGIIDAALTILRDEGLAKVTMRRIAAALDTGPASLYVYLHNTEDLHAQILDALLGDVTTPAGGDWRVRLEATLVAYRNVLFTHPEIARMALSTQPSGPNYLALVEALLALLVEGGVPDREAAWAVDLLLLYPTAVATERTSRADPAEALERSALAVQVAAADPARYPTLARLGADLLSGEGPDRFTYGLDVLITGILAGRRP
jgi:AcrR family transcriptional regulator